MPMVAPCRVMATGVFDSRKLDKFSRNSRIPTLAVCMVLPRCVHNDTTILGQHCCPPQPNPLDNWQESTASPAGPLRCSARDAEQRPITSQPPALTPRLARPAEMFAAGRAWRGAGFAEEVDAVVAQEERVGGAGFSSSCSKRLTTRAL